MSVKVRELAPGRWGLDVHLKGRRVKRRMPSKEKAEELAPQVERALEFGGEAKVMELLQGRSLANVPTFKAYAETWLKEAELRLAVTSVGRYRSSLKTHVYPALGRKRLDLIHYRDLKKLILDKVGDELGRHSVRLMLEPIRQVMAEAVEDGFIEASPVRKSLRKLYRTARRGVDRPDPFEQSELAAILEGFEDSVFYEFVALMALTGLRFGEARALKDRDLDRKKLSLLIRRSVPSHGDLKTPKTEAGNREVDVPEILVKLVDGMKKRRAPKLLKKGKRAKWLFCNAVGGMISQPNFHRAWREVLKAKKVRYRKPHSLRHTYASRLLAMGAPLTYVSKQLGHADPQITLRYYAKYLADADGRSWIEAMEGEFKSSAISGL